MTDTTTSRGPFDVQIRPADPDAATGPGDIGRLLVVKRFHGDLEADSEGEMIALRTPTEGSAGYVLLERVVGTLHGRRGSFALMHFGIMDRGTPTVRITVVPDSGTEDLTGLRGELRIDVAPGGAHAYTFDHHFDATA